jgi:hypothetical protein
MIGGGVIEMVAEGLEGDEMGVVAAVMVGTGIAAGPVSRPSGAQPLRMAPKTMQSRSCFLPNSTKLIRQYP